MMSRNVIDINRSAKGRDCGSNSSASLDCEPNTDRHTSPKTDGIGMLSVAADPGGTFGSATTATVDGQDNLAGAGDTGRQKRAIDTSASTTSVDAIACAQENPAPKRGKTSRGFTAINSNESDPAKPCQDSTKALMPLRSSASPQVCFLVDNPLYGTRPTRIRQYQLDNGETSENRAEHEAGATIAAQARDRAAKAASNSSNRVPTVWGVGDDAEALTCPAAAAKWHSQDCGNKAATKRISDDRLAGTEATQARTDCHATTREQAAAAAASATDAAYASAIAAAAAKSSPAPPGKDRELNHTKGVKHHRISLERCDATHVQAAAEDVRFYDGVKYQRKTEGALSGKLVSSGRFIIVNGEEFVEYRVLARLSFA